MTIYYEWDVEELDESGDIVDHNHCGSYAGCLNVLKRDPEPGITRRVVLIRDNDCTRSGQRSWAYMKSDWILPPMFTDANGISVAAVPSRFIVEILSTQKFERF